MLQIRVEKLQLAASRVSLFHSQQVKTINVSDGGSYQPSLTRFVCLYSTKRWEREEEEAETSSLWRIVSHHLYQINHLH